MLVGLELTDSPFVNGWDTRLNTTMIPAQFPGSTQGGVYQWLDTTAVAGEPYFYYLQDISLSGVATLHDPVSVTCIVPTAVRLGGLDAASPTAGAAPWWAAALAMVAVLGGVAAWQRRAKA